MNDSVHLIENYNLETILIINIELIHHGKHTLLFYETYWCHRNYIIGRNSNFVLIAIIGAKNLLLHRSFNRFLKQVDLKLIFHKKYLN